MDGAFKKPNNQDVLKVVAHFADPSNRPLPVKLLMHQAGANFNFLAKDL